MQKRLTNPIRKLAESGKLGGVLLILATAVSLLLSNTTYSAQYLALWQLNIPLAPVEFSILHGVNDVLMVIFFLLVGLEIKRELLVGELASRKKAMLPAIAAIGGMAVPALIYLVFNFNNKDVLHGWAIPTATDIAFSLGVLSMLGKRVPFALKVFLTALAIIDDLGAIIVIALFYTEPENFHPSFLFAGLAVLMVLFYLSRRKIFNGYLWMLAGTVVWFCILSSGVHATVAGVLVALTIPLEKIKIIEHALHKPVNYFILPVFALANTAIVISVTNAGAIVTPAGLGIIAGLFIGKPLGIALASWLAVKQRWCSFPEKINIKLIIGAGCTAGIGFTMSVFIANLSFDDVFYLDVAKLSIIAGSLLSGLVGVVYLKKQLSA